MDIHSTIHIRSVIRLLIQAMELLNKIPEEDFKELVISFGKDNDNCKGVRDNLERGNVFMILFFLREALEKALNE